MSELGRFLIVKLVCHVCSYIVLLKCASIQLLHDLLIYSVTFTDHMSHDVEFFCELIYRI